MPLALVVLLVLLQGGCSGTQQHPADDEDFSYADEPCWLSSPYGEDAKGAIGIAGRFGSPGTDLEKLSQHRAMESVADMLGVSAPSKDELEGAGPYHLGSQEVALAPVWTDGNYHFGYAYIVDRSDPGWIREECPERKCQPEKCDPEWLCADGADLNYASVVTVSQIAANLPTQYSLFFDNALDQIQAMYGVDVQSYEQVSETSDSSRGLSLNHVEESSLEFEQGADPNMVLANTCRKGTLKYARVALKGVVLADESDRWNRDWHRELRSQSPGLEIGTFSGHLSRNLLSKKIMRAVEEALVSIARSEHVDITSEEINIGRTSGGGYYGRITHAETDATVEAMVRSVRFVGDGSSPTVYVLLENSGFNE
ncbi:hypothetical protein [Halorhodospira halochloris]|uniref:hypothetical protein n=1 Tax=Halorhodospira halochloris TaxID=1052 RepID=UPI001EE97C7A|nr:hypothetical protein [Halorhodospira halochloris]MCG5547309.1 hypothetical protein [Halorhodospira halochloris]